MIQLYKSDADQTKIEEFEANLCKYFGVSGVLVCNSGTSALEMAYRACGIRHFHEVIVPSFTFVATVNIVKKLGATPVFADIEETTLGLDPQDVERKITKNTKAIVAVHYAGHPCQIKDLYQIARKYHLVLIEDMAEAITFLTGECAILSFCANKVISTQEGGALLTNQKWIYDKARLIRSHGQDGEYRYIALGDNFRMSTMQAERGLRELARVDELIKARRQVASWYRQRLNCVAQPDDNHVYQLFTIRIPNRDKVMQHLKDNGIGCKIYFKPVHLNDYYSKNKWNPVSLPVTERVSSEVLSLPMYPTLTESEVDFICSTAKEVL